MDFSVQESQKSPTGVWAFFDEIRDVNNLNPAEEENTAIECLHQEDVVGMAVIDTFPRNHITIDRIAVDKSYRRCGVGTVLLEYISSEYGSPRCEVHTDNTPSQKMIEAFGFKRDGTSRYNRLVQYKHSD